MNIHFENDLEKNVRSFLDRQIEFYLRERFGSELNIISGQLRSKLFAETLLFPVNKVLVLTKTNIIDILCRQGMKSKHCLVTPTLQGCKAVEDFLSSSHLVSFSELFVDKQD